MRLDLSSKPGLEEARERGQELAEFAKEQLELLLKQRAKLHKVRLVWNFLPVRISLDIEQLSDRVMAISH